MTVTLAELDAHEQPSDEMRAEWKHFSRLEPEALVGDGRVDDPRRPPHETGFRSAGCIARDQIARACAHLDPGLDAHADADAPILFHPLLPGKWTSGSAFRSVKRRD
ncbi:hypothetical protein HIM_06890 [Hirsutella minnesotensis 3608]|uniref:Uncharacterized protein n=1 Tax=Hirsutella minnesotensis 3608 TaxID=1043627 RepID=A0A0F7ZZ83_9HYPO|nr:hypothetical protein HIM_06890 [Hirsutella minnesotensis 3608]